MSKIHRFFLNTGFITGETYITNAELIHQMRTVLKLHEGEDVILFNGTGQKAHAVIRNYDEKGIKIEVVSLEEQNSDSQKITLYCSVLKRENFELVVQKATELGVSDIIPLITKRTIKTGLKQSRLEKIAIEAAEQCGRVQIPTIHEPISFPDALQKAQDHDLVIILHTQGGENKVKNHSYKNIGLFIGPEGGFSEEEIAEVKKYNYTIRTFPNTILRAETAAIVGVFWVRDQVLKIY
ncbi:MAG: 16S rRNA (uracil(1498)-N(3))-methyltransferase [Patescibacteria group bacterium]|nr:16S rRNA (uracil(1498)-N(3))-methyltransferase [Patescibacteria group bacterium]